MELWKGFKLVDASNYMHACIFTKVTTTLADPKYKNRMTIDGAMFTSSTR
jgi:hypothetical protein